MKMVICSRLIMMKVSPEATYSMNKIVFFGTEDFSLVSLKALVEANYPIAAVVTKPDAPKGRGHAMTKPAVKVFAEENGIEVWQPSKLNEINANIAKLEHPVGVLVSYGKIIPQTTLDLFSPGIINLHPSLLPKYRGPSPIESAIARRDDATGVSIMKLTAPMDAGPVYKQLTVPLTHRETAEQLYSSLGEIGSKLLIELLPGIVDGSLTPENQDDNVATYCELIKKSDGYIDWEADANTIEAKIRAYHIWPKARAKLGTIECIILEAAVIENVKKLSPGALSVSTELIVGCGVGALSIKTLQPLGKKEMPIEAFLSGYRSLLGD
jgi:methionyl-tRNA formyltransferase